MEYISFILIFILAISAAVLNMRRLKNNEENQFNKELSENYGKKPNIARPKNYYDNIKNFYKTHGQKIDKRQGVCGGSIDDVTWNDLEMDRVFKRLDYTRSQTGAEHLYYMLRTPLTPSGAKRLEDEVNFFSGDKEARHFVSGQFKKLGSMHDTSLYDVMDSINAFKRESNTFSLIMLALMCISLILCVKSAAGAVFFILLAIVNMFVYLSKVKSKKQCLHAFSYIIRMFITGQNIALKKYEVLKERQGALSQKECAKLLKYIAVSAAGEGRSPVSIFLDYIKMITHYDMILFRAALKEVDKNKDHILELLLTLGQIEAAVSIACFRESLSVFSRPVFRDKEFGLDMKDVFHPLINVPVPNTISAERGVLITGSNASGKSTFLKSVAISAILSQTINTAAAKSAVMNRFNIFSAMSIRDDLEHGDSYFMVEIKTVKRIFDEGQKGLPVLCFVDEVLGGTNTVERIAAAFGILKAFSASPFMCFAATHDMELTKLLESVYDNYCFTEEVDGDDIRFSYKLIRGGASKRNALRLLENAGYDADIIKEAKSLAAHFEKTGKWELTDAYGV